jgi:uncharacterized protein YndB with AHSA1/START domain
VDGYEIRVEVRVEPERVWRALVEPDQISQWFGWDAETLEDEIRFIFVDHAAADHSALTIDFEGEGEGGGQVLRVEESESGSAVRLSSRGSGDAPSSDVPGPDPIREGWIAFLYQLRRFVESHTHEQRRTLYLSGTGLAAQVAIAVDNRLPGPVWFDGDFTRAYGTADFGPGLGVLSGSDLLEADRDAKLSLTLSTWGLSERDFFELTSDWLGWWRTLVDGGEVVVYPAVGA